MKASYANRGMGLESLIEYANQQYASKGIANIVKIPTPIKVTKIAYGRIKDGFFEKVSTVDYMGDYKGQAICFEAKSSKEKTAFPLSNFEDHQIEFMRNWQGIKFVLVELEQKGTVHFMSVELLLNWWDDAKLGERKSIPFSFFDACCPVVKQYDGIVLDYLREVS